MKLACALVAACAFTTTACMHDFDAYQSSGDEDAAPSDARTTNDSTVADTGAAPCTPAPICIDNAGTCANTCALEEANCEKNCKTSGCIDACKATESTCKAKCEATCEACNDAQSGCAAAAQCTTATQ